MPEYAKNCNIWSMFCAVRLLLFAYNWYNWLSILVSREVSSFRCMFKVRRYWNAERSI